MRRTVLAMILLTAGCAGGYKASYVVGATAKQFATESYDIYGEGFNAALERCDPESNSSVNTKTELDECMGEYFKDAHHGKIETAVKFYHESSKIHTEVMSSVNSTPDERAAATKRVVESAVSLLSLFPDGEELAGKLRKLVGGI